METLEQRLDELEKRVAELEKAAQPSKTTIIDMFIKASERLKEEVKKT